MATLHPKSRRRSALSVAKLQVRDIESVVRRGNVFANRLWRLATHAARSNFVHLQSGLRIREYDPEQYEWVKEGLLDLLVYSFMLRMKLSNRRRSSYKDIDLKLGLHEDASRIADTFDLDLGRIRQRFEPIAKKGVKAATQDIRDAMNRALARATQEQLPAGDATHFVIASLRKHGVQPTSTAYVETLVRTHAAISYGSAHRISFEGDVDLWGFEYVTVGDDRVREEHERLDGVMRKKDDPFWEHFWPPNGWNCRCQVVAIYDFDAKQTPIPGGVEPDEGFDFDPGEFAR